VFARAFRRDSRWSSLQRYSLATGALAVALAVVLGAELFKGGTDSFSASSSP